MATAAHDARAVTRATSPPQQALPKSQPHRPSISVVVPTLNEAGNVRRAVESALACASTSAPSLEVIVVDGGSVDDTVSVARDAGATVISAPKGRASQCNAGARHAKGSVLLFLHADSTLPFGWDTHVDETFVNCTGTGKRIEWGTFRFALSDGKDDARRKHHSLFNLITRAVPRNIVQTSVNLRTQLLSQPYGDQGLIVRKDVFESLGGFKSNMPFLEDVEFVQRLRKQSVPAILPVPVTTSSRRFDKLGYVKTSLINNGIIAAYHGGVPVVTLQRWYVKARRMGGDV